MPIAGQGGTIKGLYGGYVAGVEAEQDYREQEEDITYKKISNVQKHNEFLEWLDRREERDLKSQANMSNSRTTINTEGERTEADRTSYNATSSNNRTTIDTEGERTTAKRAELEATTQTKNLEAETAEAERKLVQKTARLKKAKLDKAFRELRKQINDEDLDHIIGASSAFNEAVQKKVPPEQAYQQVYDSMIYLHPEGAQYAAEMLAEMGVTPQYSPEAAQHLNALSTKAYHDKQLAQKEHLLRQEWLMEIELAKAKAAAKGTKPSDLYTKPPTPAQIVSVGDRLSAIPEFDELDGTYDDEVGKYTDDKGALAASIADLGWTAAMSQKEGDTVDQGEFQMIAVDIFRDLNHHFSEDVLGTDDKLDIVNFEQQARVTISRIMALRDTWSSKEGEVPPVVHMWAIYKQELLAAVDEAMSAREQ